MTSSHSAFTTRQNPDGSLDVICLHCFLTAGTTKNKSELLAIERRHQCDPHVLLMLDRSSDEGTDEARRDEPHESQEAQHPQSTLPFSPTRWAGPTCQSNVPTQSLTLLCFVLLVAPVSNVPDRCRACAVVRGSSFR